MRSVNRTSINFIADGVAWHGTTDNGGNFVNAVKNELGHQHTRCFDHVIQLVVNKALERFEAVLGKGKAVVNAFHRSSDAATALKHAQQIKKEPVSIALCCVDVQVTGPNVGFRYNCRRSC